MVYRKFPSSIFLIGRFEELCGSSSGIPRETGTSEMGTSETGTSEMGTSEMGTSEMGTSEMCTSQMCTSQKSDNIGDEWGRRGTIWAHIQ